VNAYFGLGNTLAASGQLDAAIACYHKTIELNPKYATAWLNLGYAQFFSGKHFAAVLSFEISKELSGEVFSTSSRFFLVMAYWRSGNQEAARKCYAETVARDNTPCPERTEAEQLLGIGKPEPKPNPDGLKPDKPAPPDGADE